MPTQKTISIPNRKRGDDAETRAWHHLRWRGWRLCARNWVGSGGELDIVASRWRTLLIVEVRKRQHGAAELSVDQDKLLRTVRTARELIHTANLQRYTLRIDIMGFDANNQLTWQQDVMATLPMLVANH